MDEYLLDRAAALAAVAWKPDVTEDEAVAALELLPGLRSALDDAERRLLAAVKPHQSWAQIAALLRLGSRQAAQQHDRRLRERAG